MEENKMTETEVLTRINSLKVRHENLKREIIDHITSVEVKENELAIIEKEYVDLIGKIIS